MDVYIGMVFLFGGNFAPVNFAFCNGQLIAVNSNQALFSILGTTYGGNGTTTFGLPDLRGRVPISSGQGPGLSNYVLGEFAGEENVTLLSPNMPLHTHALMGDNRAGGHQYPGTNHVLGACASVAAGIYSTNTPNVNMAPTSIGMTGGNTPISIQQPYLTLNYIIATQGLFPTRN